jgi:hypothetical protein
VITIDAMPTSRPGSAGAVGEIETQTVTGARAVNVDTGTRLLFTAHAANPGGVKAFSIAVAQGAATLYTASTVAAPDASGNVLDGISIVGVDGAGGAGGNAITVDLDANVVVDVSAENYNGQKTTYQVVYVPCEPRLRGLPQQQTLTLHRTNAFGLSYRGTFPSVPVSGDAINLQYRSGALNYITVAKPGQTEMQCQTDPAAAVIYRGSRLYDLSGVYGATTVPLPIVVDVCVADVFATRTYERSVHGAGVRPGLKCWRNGGSRAGSKRPAVPWDGTRRARASTRHHARNRRHARCSTGGQPRIARPTPTHSRRQMKSTGRNRPKLTIRPETLRTLDADHLSRIGGGRRPDSRRASCAHNCGGNYSVLC